MQAMSTHSNKRKLDNPSHESQPSVKRQRTDETQDQDDMIPVRFQNESREYKKQELLVLEFCAAKLRRWSPNIDADEDDTHSNNPQYCINLTVFPFITSTIFTAIIHLQQVLTTSDDPCEVAKSLLKDNLTIVDLPQLFKTCKLFLIERVFNKDIFTHYFDEHAPITFETYTQLQKDHKNDEFMTAIISPQISLCSIMNNCSAQQQVYDSYNQTKQRDWAYVGHVVPNGKNAMAYCIQQIQFERMREELRENIIQERRHQDQDDYMMYEQYVYDQYNSYDDDVENTRAKAEQEHKAYINTQLRQDIDYGFCAAFDDMIQSGTNFDPFLNELLPFIECVFGDKYKRFINSNIERNEDRPDRSDFCFYALAYAVHRLFILYSEKNETVMDYGRKHRGSVLQCSGDIFDIFDTILSSWRKVKNGEDDKMKKMIQQRINDCMKWKSESCSQWKRSKFPESVLSSISKCVSDPEWLIHNFALKCNNRDCRKVLQYVLEHCMEAANVTESMNKIFEQYLGVRMERQQKQDVMH